MQAPSHIRQTESLRRLRDRLAGLEPPEKHARTPLGCRSADVALKGGLQRGALHEVFAEAGHETAATGFALAMALRFCGGKPLLWVRQDFSALEHGVLAATGLIEFGLDPARILVLRVADAVDAVRAAGDALSCTALGSVVIEAFGEPKVFTLATSRRLTLTASEHGVSAILLRFGAELEASAAETRWLVRAARSQGNDEAWGNPVFETDLARNRHGSTGHWVMEWSCDDGLFRESCKKRAADSGAVVSAPSDRPVATAMEIARGFRTFPSDN
jgi:protein ImuA